MQRDNLIQSAKCFPEAMGTEIIGLVTAFKEIVV